MKLILVTILTLFAPLLIGQESPEFYENNDEFKDLAGELRCPTCTGLSVLDSDAKFSVQIKDQVREQMKQGRSREEILDFFVERYGPWILREPPKRGFNAVAWIVPIAMLFLGPLMIWIVVWRKKVTVQTFGVRPEVEIVAEMKEALENMSKG